MCVCVPPPFAGPGGCAARWPRQRRGRHGNVSAARGRGVAARKVPRRPPRGAAPVPAIRRGAQGSGASPRPVPHRLLPPAPGQSRRGRGVRVYRCTPGWVSPKCGGPETVLSEVARPGCGLGCCGQVMASCLVMFTRVGAALPVRWRRVGQPGVGR